MKNKISGTTEKIYTAFADTLLEKDYNDLRIQDVLDKSKVARSTFYSHFKTKDDLLKSICTTIFNHVFSHTLDEEKSHDFSKSYMFDYKHFITHIFYHLYDEKYLIHAILSSRSKDIFIDYLREEVVNFATACVQNNFVNDKELPQELKINNVIESFIVIINYWNKSDFKESPEKLTDYFVVMNN